jgi:hypothetical protein
MVIYLFNETRLGCGLVTYVCVQPPSTAVCGIGNVRSVKMAVRSVTSPEPCPEFLIPITLNSVRRRPLEAFK